MTEKGSRKEKNQNIQVFVRLRPLNQRERDIKSLGVVEVVNGREVVVRASHQTAHQKRFTFDRAFGPHAKQVEVYQDVVSPLIEEVLAGYNCTVFAYGQTGTGKTHTMVGESASDEVHWQNDPLAGIIPRALSQLFDELRISNTEYNVRVSYLELYNEELFDLLSTSEDNSKLRIYEDVTRKGSNIVNGLEEITVHNKNEVYKIMAQGQERKRVASTLMNAQSSRSHTVFTIVVHMKENSPEGEELMKIGKLNLVDLAGSENISKAGSDNPAKRERARECVNINQSLLTLGRVITALVERHPHIPYRESKLTRILQESLGGRTKTSIIATISPGHKDLEETMSTLEYAHRAKNIQNKPEVNQKMTKKAILKEFVEEIDKLKRDLQAARDKNGVYLASDTFAEMTLKQEEQRKEIQELLLKKRAMEEERERMEGVFEELNSRLDRTDRELNSARSELDTTQARLRDTDHELRTTKVHCAEQKHLVATQQQTEQKLTAQAKQLVAVADTASLHASALHDTLERHRTVEHRNMEITRAFREESSAQRERIVQRAQQFTDSLLQTLNGMHSTLDNFTTSGIETQEANKKEIAELIQKLVDATTEIKSVTSSSHATLTSSAAAGRSSLQMALQTHSERAQIVLAALVEAARACLQQACNVPVKEDVQRFVQQWSSSHATLTSSAAVGRSSLQMALQTHSERAQIVLAALVEAARACLQQACDVPVKDDVQRFVQQWYTGAASRVSSLQRLHLSFVRAAREFESRRGEAARRQRGQRRARAAKRVGHVQEAIKEIEQEKAQIEKRLSKQLTDIETERQETELRLTQWMEEERRLLEERLARHVASEKEALEHRLSKKVAEVEEEKRLLEERMARHVQWQQAQIEADKEDMECDERDLEEYDGGAQECLMNMSKYDKEFDEGTSAISIDMEVFSGNVVEVVDHIHQALLRALHQAQDNVQQEAASLSDMEKAMAVELTNSTETMLNDVERDTKKALDAVVDTVESNNTHTITTLSTLASAASATSSQLSGHLVAQSGALERLQHAGVGFGSGLRQDAERHGALEARYLSQEYTVYEPTGATPARTEYRYPRQLVTTSPHERILARFRAMRQDSHEEECVVIESGSSNTSRACSDTESLSEESGGVFAAPSPPSPRAPITKCTSETDIYVRRKQEQGKENHERDRSVSHKKPSKLPAPSSHKKPLVDRNTSCN